MNKFKLLSTLALVLAPLAAANASTVYWTDWTAMAPSLVTGSIAAPSGAIGVTATGAYSGATQISGGTDYWTPSAPYISGVVSNAPPAADIITLADGGTETITFSQAVVDPLVALVSWNGNHLTFSAPIDILSYGTGYWGGGTPVNVTSNSLDGAGELHGVVRLRGTFTSFSFTHTGENWHGFTVGITSAVPEPDAAWLVLAALPLVALRRRRA
jgi:hypothetical protein